MRRMTWRRMVLGLGAAALAWPAVGAHAACNTAGLGDFSGSLGTIDSPFLLPSTPRTVTVTSPLGSDDIVSLAYQAPNGTLSLIVVTPDCKAGTWKTDVCQQQVPELPVTMCAKVTPNVVGGSITFDVPGYDDQIGPNGPTDMLPKDASPYRTGPVRVIVGPKGSVPCGYAKHSVPCPTTGDAQVEACIDSVTGPSGVRAHERVLSLTGLPAFNDFSRICDQPLGGKHGCTGDKDLQFALDTNGSMLIPMQWTRVLRKAKDDDSDCPPDQGVCDKRAVKAWTTLNSMPAGHSAIQIPKADDKALQSFNLSGRIFQTPPRFEVDTAPDGKEFVVSGDTDKHFSVLRVLSCPQGNQQCTTGRYFDVADRMKNGVGPAKAAKDKHCENTTTHCEDSASCGGGRCLRTGGELLAWETMTPPPPPPVPAPPPPPPPGAPAGDWAYWLLLLVVLGIAWYWWGRGS